MDLINRKFTPFLARCMGVAAMAVGGLLVGAPPASAVDNCIEDVWKAHGNKQDLTCTAQDVTLSKASNINIISGGQCAPEVPGGPVVCKCFSGGTVTFTADYEMDLTADTRYDIGFYLATDSDPNHDGAKTGQCSATASLVTNTLNGTFINLDAAPDACGDITGPLGTAHNPVFVRQQTSATCAAGPSGKLELPFCTTWRQPGSNQVCAGTGNGTTTNDAYPGSPSKCNCGTLVVDIFIETARITVTKTALTLSVPETGGSATYSVTVHNDAAVADVTLDKLTDDKYGDITTVHAAGGGFLAVTATDCAVGAPPGPIAAGQDYTCMFTGTMPAGDFPGSLTDVVTALGHDSFGHENLQDDDDAVVPYSDVLNPPLLTKTATAAACQTDVNYAVVVTNGSTQDTLTLNTLNDDVYGDITQVQGKVVSTTCGQSSGAGTLPAVIAASGNYSCSFVGRINTCNTTVHDTVTGTATDDDGANYSPSDDATVTSTVTLTP